MPLTLSSRVLLWLIDRKTNGGRMPDDLRLLRAATDQPVLPLHVPRRALRAVEDVTVPGADGPMAARIYRPKATPAGTVLFLHGGGFVHCGLNSHDGICCTLAGASGCTVVAPAYRLAPEHRFPAAAEDSYAALRWVAAQAGALGAGPGRVAVAGDSAGGNLAAVVAQMARDRGGPALAFQLLFYPVTHGKRDVPSRHRYGCGYFLTTELMQWYLDRYIDDDRHHASPYFAPIEGDLHGLPPARVLAAEYDPLRDEGTEYAAALRAAGVAADCVCVPGVIHGFLNFHRLQPRGLRALRDCAQALRQALEAAPA